MCACARDREWLYHRGPGIIKSVGHRERVPSSPIRSQGTQITISTEVCSKDLSLRPLIIPVAADIDFLGQTSRIFGHCRDVLKCCTSLPSSLWASPLRPTQSSKTGLRVRNRKCQILAHPSNVRKCYWNAPQNRSLFHTPSPSPRRHQHPPNLDRMIEIWTEREWLSMRGRRDHIMHRHWDMVIPRVAPFITIQFGFKD